MHVIVCLDDRRGMGFNHRRQSRDRLVIEDLLGIVGDKLLWIRPYSASLFGTRENVRVEDDPFFTGQAGDFFFVEDLPLAPHLGQIQSLTVYWWNRAYPGDIFLDVDLSQWKLSSREDFPGYSHESITKEVYLP